MKIIFNKIKEILSEKFIFHKEYCDQIQLQTELELELGFDSREMIELINELEVTFQIEINLDDIDKVIEEGETIKIKDIAHSVDVSLAKNIILKQDSI